MPLIMANFILFTLVKGYPGINAISNTELLISDTVYSIKSDFS